MTNRFPSPTHNHLPTHFLLCYSAQSLPVISDSLNRESIFFFAADWAGICIKFFFRIDTDRFPPNAAGMTKKGQADNPFHFFDRQINRMGKNLMRSLPEVAGITKRMFNGVCSCQMGQEPFRNRMKPGFFYRDFVQPTGRDYLMLDLFGFLFFDHLNF